MTDQVKPIPARPNVNSRRAAVDTTTPLEPPAAPALDPWTLLAAPFPLELIDLKPGAMNRDKTRAIAMPYADMRAYQSRLDSVVGVDGWRVSYRPWGERAVLCELSILGITREDVGEAELEEPTRGGEMRPNPNVATGAVAQAFKRTCAAFGLGRYLYSLPEVWGDYDNQKRAFVEPQKLAAQLYREGGIDLSRRAQLISRIGVLLGGLDEEGLIRVGKCAANK